MLGIRQLSTTEAGIVTYGFTSLLSALEKLPPTELLTAPRSPLLNGTAPFCQTKPIGSWASCSSGADFLRRTKNAWSGFGET
ncbi:hypothetical protein ACVWY3_002608 [Bradyrhizobium sp. USDA 4486]